MMTWSFAALAPLPLAARRLRQAGLLAACAVLAACGAGHTASVTRQQMEALLPEARDLPGMASTRPVDGTMAMGARHAPARVVPTGVWLDRHDHRGTNHAIARPLWSQDGVYHLSISVGVSELTPTIQPDPARNSAVRRPGTLSGAPTIGDECNNLPSSDGGIIAYRAGRTSVQLRGSRSSVATRSKVSAVFPPAAIEAVAMAILVRAARQPQLTGVTATHPPVAVMGKTLPQDDAAEIAGRIYVHTGAAMAAAGWKHEWEAKTGVLVLRHPAWTRKAITLRTLPAKGAEDITVPLWSDDGRPMMLLTDLVSVTGATLWKDKQGTYQVTGLGT